MYGIIFGACGPRVYEVYTYIALRFVGWGQAVLLGRTSGIPKCYVHVNFKEEFFDFLAQLECKVNCEPPDPEIAFENLTLGCLGGTNVAGAAAAAAAAAGAIPQLYSGVYATLGS